MPRKRMKKNVEEQLASVVEQEGVTLNTPQGLRVRRRTKDDNDVYLSTVNGRRQKPDDARANKPIHSPSKKIKLTARGAQDPIEALDRAAVERMNLRAEYLHRGATIPIFHREHARSAYVVSLQRVSVTAPTTADDERVPVHANFSDARVPLASPSLETYMTMSADLACDVDLNPRDIVQQFTPPTFEEAYARVNGRFSNFTYQLSMTARAVTSSITQRIRRIERTEERAMEKIVIAAEHAIEETAESLESSKISFAHAVAAFAGCAFLVTLPANAVILYQSASQQQVRARDAGMLALAELATATQSGSIAASAEAFRRASQRFRAIDKTVGEANALAIGLASLMPQRLRNTRALLEVGDTASTAGRMLTLGLDKLFADSHRRLDERLDSVNSYTHTAMTLLSEASATASEIQADGLPKDARAKLPLLVASLEQSQQTLHEFSTLSHLLSTMVGKNNLRRYLFLFQNQTELRPTGGFIGSIAEVTFTGGAINKIFVPPGGTYDLKGQLMARVVAPEPLRLVSARWYLHDANWSPDFPTSAKQIRWFWSKANQPTIDGVIAMNASVVERLLHVTGPIDLPTYGKTIDASNFLIETQKAVELEYDKAANTPKKIIGDLATEIIARSKYFTREEWLRVAHIVSNALETKDIQLALTRPEEEAIAERYGWSGRIKSVSGDSLALIEANIAGQKTDGVISETVLHEARIQEDGSIEDTVTLRRTHGGKKGELFRGVRNVSYLRAYVPPGSTVRAATGFQTPDPLLFKPVDEDDTPDATWQTSEAATRRVAPGVTVTNEGDRTVIGGWMQLDPGTSQIITLRYRLPFRVQNMLPAVNDAAKSSREQPPSGAYLLLFTSQSGKSERALESRVYLPATWRASWTRLAQTTSVGRLTYRGAWDRDHVIAALFSSSTETSITE